MTGDGLNRQIGRGDLALLCEVQAFPAPLTRYVLRRRFTSLEQPLDVGVESIRFQIRIVRKDKPF